MTFGQSPPETSEFPEAARRFARSRGLRRGVAIDRKIDEVDRSVNALYAARAGLPLLCGRSPTPFSRTLLTPRVRDRWRSQISELGPPPSISERRSCLNDVLKCSDTYNLDQISSRRPYDTEQVRVAKDGGVHPKRVQDVVGPAAIPVVTNPERWIFRSDSELSDLREDDLPRAYTDPLLKNPKKMRELVLLLHRAGVLGFRRKARAKVGVFTVTKSKAGQLRLVVDCRLPNALHREPPFSDLATAGAFSNLDLSDAGLGACDDPSGHPQSPCGVPLNISISEIDLVDSFYQFAFEEVASFFCLDHPLQAKELSISEVYDDDLGRFDATHPDEWLFPAFRVMPMGWSWSLWLCQNALVDAMVASEVARTGQPRPDVEARVLVDHRPAPLLAPGKPILAPYVDNGIIIAWSPDESRDANRHLASELSNRGFAYP